ncbi:MAG: hypothetical protein RLZZ406_155, partial [Pseudomonadota bacterium]
MIESIAEAQYVWSHKAKIALFLSAMRHFAAQLKKLKYPLTYIQSSPLSIVETLKEKMIQEGVTDLICVEPGEWRLKQEIEELARELSLKLERLEYFYRLMRKRHNILVNSEGNPEGGQWNFDQDNRKAYPKKGPGIIEAPVLFEPDAVTKEVLDFVNANYPNHPGALDHFRWPVTRAQALEALDYFVEYRLRNFGVFQDAMWTDTPFGWHSMLSSSLNLKLLNPREVIAAVLQAWQKYSLDLSTVEGFIRQILGWREFVRGMYYLDMPKMAQDNYYAHQRALPKW